MGPGIHLLQFVIVGAGAACLMTGRELWAREQKGDCR